MDIDQIPPYYYHYMGKFTKLADDTCFITFQEKLDDKPLLKTLDPSVHFGICMDFRNVGSRTRFLYGPGEPGQTIEESMYANTQLVYGLGLPIAKIHGGCSAGSQNTDFQRASCGGIYAPDKDKLGLRDNNAVLIEPSPTFFVQASVIPMPSPPPQPIQSPPPFSPPHPSPPPGEAYSPSAVIR
jgi:hypothetical protein